MREARDPKNALVVNINITASKYTLHWQNTVWICRIVYESSARPIADINFGDCILLI